MVWHIIFTRPKIYFLICVIIAIIALFCLWQNNAIITRQFQYSNTRVPKEFNGFKIVQISDLHNKKFGKNQTRLLKKIQQVSPDIIIITGDLIDRRRYDLDTSLAFINGAMQIAPIYYVSGNHEAWSRDYNNITEKLSAANVEILDDTKVKIRLGESQIEILGLSDPAFLTSSYKEETNISDFKKHLNYLSDPHKFQVLLSHRPEFFDLYKESHIDLIFAGHAHGGQIRIPFIGGIIAPNQGLFPKFTSGAYTEDKSTMFVSRGLGNSIFPIRIFNRPEILVLTLENNEDFSVIEMNNKRN